MLKYDIKKDFCTKGPRIRGKSARFKKNVRPKEKKVGLFGITYLPSMLSGINMDVASQQARAAQQAAMAQAQNQDIGYLRQQQSFSSQVRASSLGSLGQSGINGLTGGAFGST